VAPNVRCSWRRAWHARRHSRRSCPARRFIWSAAAERHPLVDTSTPRRDGRFFLWVPRSRECPWPNAKRFGQQSRQRAWSSGGEFAPSKPSSIAGAGPAARRPSPILSGDSQGGELTFGHACTYSGAAGDPRRMVRQGSFRCVTKVGRSLAAAPGLRLFACRRDRVQFGVSSNVRCCWRWRWNAPRHSLRSCPRRVIV
jgi:hypothetical protein